MEHKFYTDNFERLLKEKSDEFRMYPSKRVWHSIYNDLHPGRKWPSIAVSLILVATLFLIGFWNNNANTESAAKSSQQLAQNANQKYLSGSDANKLQQNSNQQSSNHGNSFATDKQPQQGVNINSAHPSVIANAAIPSTTNQNNSLVKADNQNQYLQKSESDNTGKENSLTVNSVGKNNTTVAPGIITNSSLVNNNTSKELSPEVIKNDITALLPENDDDNGIALKSTTDAENKTEPANNNTTTGINKDAVTVADKAGAKTNANKQLSNDDRSWIEHYALYNKTSRKRWKGRLSSEIYITPGASLRTWQSNTDYVAAVPALFTSGGSNNAGNKPVYNSGITFQAGAGFSYSIAKNIRIKAGVQASFTNYSMPVTDINHPVLTTLTLNDLNSGYPYIETRVSTIANVPGANNKKIHNQTSQISLPVGVAVKLAGGNKVDWYAGATVQPTYIMGGKAYLISSDHNNYVADPAMLRKWNLNGAFETYIHYKMSNGLSLQAGPEFRHQFMSTFSKKYTYSEKLQNIGLKIGIVKNL